jgi:hypothetical protein
MNGPRLDDSISIFPMQKINAKIELELYVLFKIGISINIFLLKHFIFKKRTQVTSSNVTNVFLF